ncbi:MAG TPA: DUF4251 domain-containing protein [Bacteroidales bacterium]|jgi:hypothetical protein|nr:DUF4251 domain-containing protein [Bacteroidales bacterium]HON54606.1 DUF4251 domain-containing protein [Bacteroidales bacterium]HRR48836.1 DUF4251 domain-containing protein [Bacteroidales bacterium]HRT33403.1 DUF4251 domain-containing protein [Bacteroidales bacterium]HRT83884.1 DUF4251 domain-containing protein [Bacteroidales bacterium]
MKRFLLIAIMSFVAFSVGYSQNKAEKEAAAQVLFESAKAAIESKDFVIVPDSYENEDGSMETNTDNSHFLAYEGGQYLFLQGSIVCNNNYTNKTTVNSFEQKVDKKGNLSVLMQISGSQINARVEIMVRKGTNYAEVIITPSSGKTKKFSGEVVPRSKAKYYKKSNII